MIHIYTGGTEIALPSDLSFQYNVENPFVSESEGYSMSIEVPVAAGRNMEIFGIIQRMDADISTIRLDADLISPQYCASGVLAVVGVTENTVKLQFLQGRSAQNFNARLDETYVNELDLGKSPLSYSAHLVAPGEALKSIDAGGVAVALPWIMSASGETVHNELGYIRSTQELAWNPDLRKVSYMPYLVVVAERICAAAGYSFDFSAWRASEKRHLIVCNVMPESLQMYNFAYPLPHWTISEFFANIEPLLGGRFSIDTVARHIVFTTDTSRLQSAGEIVLDKVIDEFSVTLEVDPEKEERPEFLRNRGYDDNSGRFWPVRCCDWYIRQRLSDKGEPEESQPASYAATGSGGTGRVGGRPGWAYETMRDHGVFRQIRKFDTLAELVAYARKFEYSKNSPGFEGDALMYAADCRSFFSLRAVDIVDLKDVPKEFTDLYQLNGTGGFYHNYIYPVNDFGDYILDDSDDADRIDLKAVPVDLDDVGRTVYCFLPFSDASEGTESVDDGEIRQPKSFSLILDGKKDRPQYYDRLYVAYWTGLRTGYRQTGIYPLTSNVTFPDGWNYEISPQGCDLRLNSGFIYGSPDFLGVDFHKVYKISFLSDNIPDVSATFNIRGKRYICRKLTADFTVDGMSKAISGEFYRLD